jgi:hypothetical protein
LGRSLRSLKGYVIARSKGEYDEMEHYVRIV